jgi:hypothetical protein
VPFISNSAVCCLYTASTDQLLLVPKSVANPDGVDLENKRTVTTAKAAYQEYIAKCYSPKLIPKETSFVQIGIATGRGQVSSRPQILLFYDTPVVRSFYPLSGSYLGGYEFYIYVEKVNTILFINPKMQAYVKFGNSQPENCDYTDTDPKIVTLVCKLHPHEANLVTVAVSFNKIQWFQANGTFEFIPCPAGSATDKFDQPCKLCPAGTYKPTEGNYPCVPCPVGTYSESPESIDCKACPSNATTTNMGSNSAFVCGCKPGFIVNPIDTYPFCIPCPHGAKCDSLNVSKPYPQKGFWNTAPDYYKIISCVPQDACPGEAYANCKHGYQGYACALCINGYYKWNKGCQSCGDYAFVRLLLVVLFVVIVGGIFVAFTSITASHISSLAIVSSFWQIIAVFNNFDVNWPTGVGNTFTAASVVNFNTDFLSPQCLFPGINYLTRWVFTLASPFIVLVGFALIYTGAEIRSVIARYTGKLFANVKYRRYYCITNYEDTSIWMKAKQQWTFHSLSCVNILLWVYNCVIWSAKAPSTRAHLKRFFNKCINGYLTFCSFSFVYIIGNASDIFVCTYQPAAGVYTLNSSTDIQCYTGQWYFMLPFSLFIYLFFGVGALVLFTYIYQAKNRLRNSDFDERFNFIIKRFKKARFYWEGVATIRKLTLSILYTFLKPMLVIVFCIFLQLISLILHIEFVPFKKKFHNVMEYMVLVTTLVILMFGLLFFVRKWPEPWMESASTVIVIIIIIASSVLLVAGVLWDINTRRKKEGKRARERRKHLAQGNKKYIRRRVALPPGMAEKRYRVSLIEEEKYEEEKQQDPNFIPTIFESETESSEDKDTTMNDIFANLLSRRRLQKKVHLVKEKGKKTAEKIEDARKKSMQRLNSIAKIATPGNTGSTTPRNSNLCRVTDDRPAVTTSPEQQANKLLALKKLQRQGPAADDPPAESSRSPSTPASVASDDPLIQNP